MSDLATFVPFSCFGLNYGLIQVSVCCRADNLTLKYWCFNNRTDHLCPDSRIKSLTESSKKVSEASHSSPLPPLSIGFILAAISHVILGSSDFSNNLRF